METGTTVKQIIVNLKKEFRGVDKITVSYYGAGDSFESFSDVNFFRDGKPLNINASDFSDNHADILDKVLEISDADFNNEGSEGSITFDLKKGKIFIDNYHVYQARKHSGTFTLKDEHLTEPKVK